MIEQPRDKKGKFGFKGKEERKVRTLRLTDSTWNKLGDLAKRRCITRTELIEEILNQGELNVDEAIKLLKEALTLKANAGGAIKEKIRKALEML